MNLNVRKNKLILYTFILINLLNLRAFSNPDDLVSKLKKIPGAFIKRIKPLNGFKEAFQIAFIQPVDHNNPNSKKFTQRLYIDHLGFSKPVVFETHGYDVPWHKKRELSELLSANLVIIEHRYFGRSKPKFVGWKYLTSWQAASDHHRVIKMLKTIYSGKFVSTGKSKGGMAALFHRAHYPDDVDASVVFVAPVILGLKDGRFPDHINKLGGLKIKKKIEKFQIICLKKKN